MAERTKPRRGAWNLGAGDAETVLIQARNAFFVMVGFLALIWALQIANWADGYRLTQDYGIKPLHVSSLPDLITAPFLHFSWSHIEGNSGPLFIFGFLAAYRGIAKFFGVTAVVILTSGLAAWLAEGYHSFGAGASGVVFGYLGYIMVRGLFDRHVIDIVIGAVMALCFAYQFTVLLPHAGIGWQAHVGGLVGGILAGWIFRERRTARKGSGALGGQAAAATSGGARPGKDIAGRPGKDVAIDPANPRADLHKQLDDLGL